MSITENTMIEYHVKKQDTKLYLNLKIQMCEKRNEYIIYTPETRSERNQANKLK